MVFRPGPNVLLHRWELCPVAGAVFLPRDGVGDNRRKDLEMALTCYICSKFNHHGFFVIPVGIWGAENALGAVWDQIPI